MRAIRFVFEPGYSIRLGFGASGKLLLAQLPESERAAYLAQLNESDLEFTPRIPELEAELASIARDDNAYCDEFDDGVWACAAAIHDRGETPVGDAAISVVGPAFRIGEDERRHIRGVVIEAAAAVTNKLARYK